jgi:hypothetical protein
MARWPAIAALRQDRTTALAVGLALSLAAFSPASLAASPNPPAHGTRAASSSTHRSKRIKSKHGKHKRAKRLLGNSAVGSRRNSVGAGRSRAFRFRALATGPVAVAHVYIDSGSTANSVIVGLYSDVDGTPGILLSKGLTHSPLPGAWNSVSLAKAHLRDHAAYWLAMLGVGGVLRYRETQPGQCAGQASSQSQLSSLPSAWGQGVTQKSCTVSAYVTPPAEAPPQEFAPLTINDTLLEVSPVVEVAVPPPPTPPPAPAPVAPSNIAAPAISGVPMEGQVLASSEGEWSGSPTSYSYQWQTCNAKGEECTDVEDANEGSYTLGSADVGDTLRVVLTALNVAGSATAVSLPTAVIQELAPPPPANTTPPEIAGEPVEGEVLSSSTGKWTEHPTSYSYQWQDCNAQGTGCTDIEGAVDSTYTLAASDVGETIRVTVSARNAGGVVVASSEASEVVQPEPPPTPLPPVNTALPTISGEALEGSVLSASEGEWSGLLITFSLQWQRCSSSGTSCSNVAGATHSTYSLTASDVGHTLRVAVKATTVLGGATVADSHTTEVVAEPPTPAPSNTAPPVISGVTVQGHTLSSSEGSWTGDPTSYAYQWQRCNSSGGTCSSVSGATHSTYNLGSGDVAHTLRVVVTATNEGGSAPATSAASAVITAPPPAPPTNSALPAITGSAIEGETLKASQGTWTGSPTSYTYQWQRCSSAGTSCSSVSGATGTSYSLSAIDVEHTLRVVVTATNAGGSASATSAASAVISAPTPPPTNSALPGISGTTVEGETLSASKGTWTGSPTSYTYQWQDCNSSGSSCAAISGATSSSHELSSSDVGHTLRVVVTATNAGGSTPATSTASAVIAAPPPPAPTNSALPAITGTTVEGETLSTSKGTWTGSPTSYTYQWQDCNTSGTSCVIISGASNSSHKLSSSDVGHTLRVVVTATNAGGSTPASSAASAVINASAPPPPTDSALPAITGSAVEGETLSASKGTWTGSPTSYTYQWRQCSSAGTSCSSVSGATGTSYSLSAIDVGHTLRVVVTATNAGGSTPATSAASAVISASTPPPPTNSALPAISGTTIEGETLSASKGTWTSSPTSYTYQWQDCNTSGTSCVNISGASSSSHELSSSDVGHTLRVVVTATNAGGGTPATSAASAVITAAKPQAPTNSVLPAISGTTTEGQTLSTTKGTWTGSPTSYTYQWQDCNTSGSSCVNISGASSSSYKLSTNDVGQTLRVIVTATNAGGSTPATSGHTATIAAHSTQSDCFSAPGACGYPDPSYANVGPSAACSTLTPSGSITVSTAGATIQNMNIKGSVTVSAKNVTLTNDCITLNGKADNSSQIVKITSGDTGTQITHSNITGGNPTNESVEEALSNNSQNANTTADHDYIANCGECVHGEWTLTNSYVTANANIDNAHYEDIYCNDTTFIAEHDVLINPHEQTANLFCDTNNGNGGPADDHITLKNTLLAGGGYSIYPQSSSTSVGTSTMNITGNRFARCHSAEVYEPSSGGTSCRNGADAFGIWPFGGYYGTDAWIYCPPTKGQEWSNNVWDDNNETIGC